MKTFKIYTVSQVLTVNNCKDLDDAIKKAGLSKDAIFKTEEVPADLEHLKFLNKGAQTVRKIKYPDGTEGDLNGNFMVIL